MTPRAWGCNAIAYVWGAMAWCCGWRYATVILAGPAVVIFLVGFARAVIRHVQIQLAVRRAFKR